MTRELETTCRRCGEKHRLAHCSSINAATDPDLKQQVLDGSLFVWECPHCGERNLDAEPLLYIDPEARLLAVLSAEEIGLAVPQDGPYAGFAVRRAATPGALIELVKAFDAGLDDAALDLCKQVTRMELGKDALELRFFRLNGPDNEIIFTYPQDGEMKMIAVGFNVYEDCRRILSARGGGRRR